MDQFPTEPQPAQKTDFTKSIQIFDIHGFNAYFTWGQDTVGFGELSVSVKDGKVSMDTEGMGRDWTRRALHSLVETILEAGFETDGRPK